VATKTYIEVKRKERRSMTVEPIDAIPETFAWVGSNGGYTV
jgi:hypothetical protein